MQTDFKSGFIALIGQPNVGKSTLMNRLVGQKVAITSQKPQTTRNKISGIYTDKQMQIVFVDTPGIFKARTKLDAYMDRASFSSLKDVDLVFLMVEPEKAGAAQKELIKQLSQLKIPVFLLINKVDRIHPDKLLPIIDSYQHLGQFQEILPISARAQIGLSDLLATSRKYLPAGPQYYGSDQITDRPEYFVVAELIREQLLKLTQQEVPHASCVEVERMRDHEQGKLQIYATIYVEKDGQKGIVIGKGAKMLKQIGINSRQQIETLLGEKVNLHLLVKVHPHWREDPNFLKRVGYDKKELS
jgi:GTP-binding protein Era